MKATLRLFTFALWIQFLSSVSLHAQETLTIAGRDFHDAAVRLDGRAGKEYIANSNYGTLPRITSTAWTASGVNTFARTLMHFNLSAVPYGATIQSATIYLYSDPVFASSSVEVGNSQLSGSNAFYFEKVTQEWDNPSVCVLTDRNEYKAIM